MGGKRSKDYGRREDKHREWEKESDRDYERRQDRDRESRKKRQRDYERRQDRDRESRKKRQRDYERRQDRDRESRKKRQREYQECIWPSKRYCITVIFQVFQQVLSKLFCYRKRVTGFDVLPQSSTTLDAKQQSTSITKLPEDVLLTNILSTLPTRQYIESSQVTSQWRDLWKTFPYLDIDAAQFRTFDKFRQFVDGFLGTLGDSIIEKFRVVSRGVSYSNDGPCFNAWLIQALNNGVKHLELVNVSTGHLPYSFYFCPNLVSIFLSSPCLEEVRGALLPNVKKLILFRPSLRTTNKALSSLIEACPSIVDLQIDVEREDEMVPLEDRRLTKITVFSNTLTLLKISYSRWDENEGQDVTIDAPCLLSFTVKGCQCGRVNITRFSPNCNVVVNIESSNNLLQAIKDCKELSFGGGTLKEVVRMDNVAKQTPFFKNLSTLRVSSFKVGDWLFLKKILGHSPLLKHLILAGVSIKIVNRQTFMSYVDNLQ